MRPLPTLALEWPAYRLRPADGLVEFSISQSATARASRPARVTQLLSAALASIGDTPVTPELVRGLSAGTREWLLQRVAALFGARESWFEAACHHCGAPYDFALDLGTMPSKPAGESYPVVVVETSLGTRRFEVPNGADEETVASTDGGDARRAFAALCGLADSAARDAEQFTEADLAVIDAALDAVAPQPSVASATMCPACGEATEATIDPLRFAFPAVTALLGEVHRIASRYHWSEDAILQLPTQRRRQYLDLIRQDGPRTPVGGRR